jgi:WD40 repeat protein
VPSSADLASADISVKFLFGHDGRGIGAVDVHPGLVYIAVGEKGDSPNVYIYEYPSLKVFRILRKGTERAYSDVSFSADGNLLATVGAAPDFLLTVWDWRQERMVLRTKAFSQEVPSRRLLVV